MNERPVTPTDDIVSRQKNAGDPAKSIWVSANAGSGKTHILTERVLRLLLSGVSPEDILCLTYTKAAAAEMKSRVAERLGEWALLDDEILSRRVHEISQKRPDRRMIAHARTLFARALETPGGLKINTIHAFCEAALHRFPLEAEVPVNFKVIEDAERAELINNARQYVLSKGLGGDEKLGDAVAGLFARLSDAQIDDAINASLGKGEALRAVLRNPDQAKKNLRNLLNARELLPARVIMQSAHKKCTFSKELADQVFALTPPDVKKNRFEDKLARMDWGQTNLEKFFDAFLTKDGAIPKNGFPKKPIPQDAPLLTEQILAQADTLAQIFAQIKKARLIENSEAIIDVVAAIYTAYGHAKSAMDRLDFDDLIVKFATLLSSKTSADWVRYKLDAGMTHILVDESQDTNASQWHVIEQLVDDFFAGDSAAQRQRTIFGVGDEKQSIYGFQGAEPALFGQTGSRLRRRAEKADNAWENVPFRASFRTKDKILLAVDKVCAREDIRAALFSVDQPVSHESARDDKGGKVILWPPPEKQESPKLANEWPMEPTAPPKSNARMSAELIISQIKFWLTSKRALGARQRAVRPDDILILVQTRGPVFHEVIRALKNADLPTPGADRLSVTDHIVVHDLLALGDVLLNPEDDLTLATLLRSPLLGLSLAEVEDLCIGREKKERVWHRLKKATEKQSAAKKTYEYLHGLRKILDFDRPYEFFSRVLFAEQGLKKIHARLGNEVDEIIDTFLDLALEHEQSSQPSLQGFLASIRKRNISIKRELSESANGVRVMTVHGAKGLEAPIVILADATSNAIKTGPVFFGDEACPMLVHAGDKEAHTIETTEKFREPALARETAEYWRKLYVAMTRAEDELYVTGFKPEPTTNPHLTWYGALKEALSPLCTDIAIHGREETGLCFPQDHVPETANVGQDETSPPECDISHIVPVSAYEFVKTIRPSTAKVKRNADDYDTIREQVEIARVI
ncbi:MAG TPA: double-strand break repair helicase AddA [Devosia sp.]|nr:double-strand break repair helicase AddA [Devosia sp.]